MWLYLFECMLLKNNLVGKYIDIILEIFFILVIMLGFFIDLKVRSIG